MTRTAQPTITVKARAYRQKGESSAHAVRAAVVDTGMKVSCPSVWRDDWREGELIEFTGRVVNQNCGAPYFRAVAQLRTEAA